MTAATVQAKAKAKAKAKAVQPERVMTLGELQDVLSDFCVWLRCLDRDFWAGRCAAVVEGQVKHYGATGASPSAVVLGLLRKIGGANG